MAAVIIGSGSIHPFFRLSLSVSFLLSFPRDPGAHESDIQVCTPILGRMYLFMTYQKTTIAPSISRSFIIYSPFLKQ
jgi:hypothetical protein